MVALSTLDGQIFYFLLSVSCIHVKRGNYKLQPTRCNFSWIYVFILTDALHVSGGSSAYHQEHMTVHTASGIVKPILLLAATATSSSIGLTTPEAVCTVMCSWWWAEEPPEACRASVKINKFKKSCISLVVICNYITMHGHVNIKNEYTKI